MEELPFECDCTDAANPGGLNVLAIRITNPFGRFDWVDGLNAKWGKSALPLPRLRRARSWHHDQRTWTESEY